MQDKPRVHIKKIKMKNGKDININEKDRIIIVGPNNAGKSKFIEDIKNILQNGERNNSICINDVEIEKNMDMDNLKKYLKDKGVYRNNNRTYEIGAWVFHETDIINWKGKYLLNTTVNGFLKKISTEDRLSISKIQNSVSRSEVKSKPQHILYFSEQKTKKISDIFRKAFGCSLVINIKGGKEIPIHIVFDESKLNNFQNKASDEYIEELIKNPLLHEQGDGMRSYAGIIFESIVENYDITLIDEPEAFLHPPQMRRLGETLVGEVNGQLIISTHSSDILRGCMEGSKSDLRIIRIQRDNNFNDIKEINKDDLSNIWKNPKLRYSNILDGIFHEQIIVCEDDSDCKMYNSISDFINEDENQNWEDTLYVPAGGKQAMSFLVKNARLFGVKTKAIYDIDILHKEEDMKSVVDAFGGDWNDIAKDWKILKNNVENSRNNRDICSIKKKIIDLISGSEGNYLPEKEIYDLLRVDSPWKEIKKYGVSFFRGNDFNTYNSISKKLENMGIFIVDKGQIESFFPEVNLHGPKFVNEVLEKIPLNNEKYEEIKIFIRKVFR